MLIFAANLLEAASVTPAPASAGVLARLTDRDIASQYIGTVGAITITVDLGASPGPVSAWALLHHNLTGVTVMLTGDTFYPPTTVRDSLDPAGADLLRTFAPVTVRYWQWTIPALAGAAAPAIGELLLGVPREVADAPSLPTGWPAVVGNVARDRSPSGITWATRRGPARARLALEWSGLPEGDLEALLAAYTEAAEGALPLLLQDASGVVRWVTWTDPEIAPEALGGGLFHVRSTFEEIP
jgi:hypothetical protein